MIHSNMVMSGGHFLMKAATFLIKKDPSYFEGPDRLIRSWLPCNRPLRADRLDVRTTIQLSRRTRKAQNGATRPVNPSGQRAGTVG
jgi:hypothetical protein